MTNSGSDFEKAIVAKINQGVIPLPNEFSSIPNICAVHVITKQPSLANYSKKVYPKADIYLMSSTNPSLPRITDYIDELSAIELGYKPVIGSGISVKLSPNYSTTIQKFSPSSFEYVFGSLELGAGASIYSGSSEIYKNPSVILGWGSNESKFCEYFQNKGIDTTELNSSTLLSIKQLSNQLINRYANNNEAIQNMLFCGINIFSEPYTAPWITYGLAIEPNKPRKLTVTTGSGRSKGDFTLVFKPAH